MSSSEKQNSKSNSEPISARLGGLTEEQLLHLPSGSAQADNRNLTAPGIENSAALSGAAGNGTSLFGNCSAELEGDNFFAFYPSTGQTSEDSRPSLVDAVIEQLRHARLKRQRPH